MTSSRRLVVLATAALAAVLLFRIVQQCMGAHSPTLRTSLYCCSHHILMQCMRVPLATLLASLQFDLCRSVDLFTHGAAQ